MDWPLCSRYFTFDEDFVTWSGGAAISAGLLWRDEDSTCCPECGQFQNFGAVEKNLSRTNPPRSGSRRFLKKSRFGRAARELQRWRSESPRNLGAAGRAFS